MPGPTPIFTERLDLKVSREQRAQVEQWALIMGMSVSELVRTVLVAGLTDIETAATNDPDVLAAHNETRKRHAPTQ